MTKPKLTLWDILLIVIVATALYIAFGMSPEENWRAHDQELRDLRKQEERINIRFYAQVWRYGLLVVCGLVGIVILTKTLADHRRASIQIAEIHGSKIPLRYQDLRNVTPPATIGMVHAEIMRQANAGSRSAFDFAGRVIHLSQQIASGRRGCETTMLDADDPPALPAGPVPTFRELFDAGEIAQNKPMILCYVAGQPRRGDFLDIYSAAIAGETGSGKTYTLLYLIGSGLVHGVQYIGIDPHYPHPKSLSFKTQALWKQGMIEMATFYDEMVIALKKIEQEIETRLRNPGQQIPLVLVIDELAFLSTTSIAPHLWRVMERVSTEGRKCEVYMLASSQTWLATRTGGDTVIRDTLTSAYVHRMKPKQAGYLLQDKTQTELVKREVKQPGDVLFCPVNEEAVVGRIPYTTEQDMVVVAERLKTMRQTRYVTSGRDEMKNTSPDTAKELTAPEGEFCQDTCLANGVHYGTDVKQVSTPDDITPDILSAKVRDLMAEQPALTQGAIAIRCGIPETSFSKKMKGERPLTPIEKAHIFTALFWQDKHVAP